jgi:hypothetical protein
MRQIDVALTVLVRVGVPDEAPLLADVTGETEQLKAFIGHVAATAVKIESGDVPVEFVEATPCDVNLRSG